jgi:membrane-bound lytic murein transglycosylase D
VPVGQKERLLATIEKVPQSGPPQPEFAYHRVRHGENLSTIARRYHTSVKKIMWANNLKKSSYIVAGKKLKIPQHGTMLTPPATAGRAKDQWNQQHVVKSGDSLWNLAKRYDTTVSKIQEMNNLSTTRLIIDQRLKVPSAADIASSTYKVKRGDSPHRIASQHQMSLNHFLEINKLTSRSTIYPGQSVRIE